MNTFNAQRNFKLYLPLIRLALDKISVLPARSFDLSEWNKVIEKEIFIDGTEIPVQRPRRPHLKINTIRRSYTLVKKRHRLKCTVLSRKNKWIDYLSELREGKIHDYKMLQTDFPASFNWFDTLTVHIDLERVLDKIL